MLWVFQRVPRPPVNVSQADIVPPSPIIVVGGVVPSPASINTCINPSFVPEPNPPVLLIYACSKVMS